MMATGDEPKYTIFCLIIDIWNEVDALSLESGNEPSRCTLKKDKKTSKLMD